MEDRGLCRSYPILGLMATLSLLKERERLGREITELRRKRNARDDEPAAGSSDDEDDPGAASEDDDRPDVQPDIEKVFSDDDDSVGDFDPP